MFNTYRLSLQSLISKRKLTSRDEKEADLLTKVGLIIILASIGLGLPLTIYFTLKLDYINMLAAGGAVIINLFAFALFKRRGIQHALVLKTTFSYFSLLIVIFFNDGLYDVGIQILYPVIMIIGIVLKLRTLWLYSTITLAWLALMIYFDSLGFYTASGSNDHPLVKGFIIISMYILSMVLLRYFLQTTIVANEHLSQAKIAADEANKLKSSFLATMSHELRTPLNAIIGYSEDVIDIAKSTENLDPDITSDVARIRQSGRHLLTLINDILDLSKLEAEQMELFIQEVDPQQIIKQVIQRAKPLTEKNKNDLTLVSDTLDTPIYTDGDKLKQICFNLVSNAAKYTQAGSVTIRLSTLEHGKLRVIVSDTGIGISAEKLPHIYDTFQQVDGSLSRSFEGTGLGLAITKRLVSLLGGIITVESEVGKGTTFTVVLPNLEP